LVLVQEGVVDGVLKTDPAVARALSVLPRQILQCHVVDAAEALDA
jgi:hypothetical protein